VVELGSIPGLSEEFENNKKINIETLEMISRRRATE